MFRIHLFKAVCCTFNKTYTFAYCCNARIFCKLAMVLIIYFFHKYCHRFKGFQRFSCLFWKKSVLICVISGLKKAYFIRLKPLNLISYHDFVQLFIKKTSKKVLMIITGYFKNDSRSYKTLVNRTQNSK